jgi:D-hexose-6-phosphate mutarotase
MRNSSFLDHWKKFEIPGSVVFSQDDDGLDKINITTEFSTAEVYLQGAHVTAFQKKGEDPMLFMSSSGRMARGTMLHGGIPLCFPWFGKRDGEALSHGFARLHPWDLTRILHLDHLRKPGSQMDVALESHFDLGGRDSYSPTSKCSPALPHQPSQPPSHDQSEISGLKLVEVTSQGSIMLEFHLPQELMKAAGWLPVSTIYRVVVGETLSLQLQVTNPPTNTESFFYEECFHSYFLVEDVEKVTIHGLKDLHYLDKTENLVSKLELSDAMPITQETNRIYLNSTEPIEIHDPLKKRIIRIEKQASRSTVVWNPWIENAKSIPDFAPEDYKKMLCVESGNVGKYSQELAPGGALDLSVELSSRKDS